MFEINKIYKRSDLHDTYGGSRQSGIASCANYPIILIFTGKAGERHGYEDGWDNENYFHYTGEGQLGDMTFTRGNLALQSHEKNQKAVYLFENDSKGFWRFVDQMELVDYAYFDTPDTTGDLRKGIKFKLKSATEQSINSKGELRKSKNYNKPDKTERKGLVTSRVGQGWYRKNLIERWGGKCAVTSCSIVEILIASHIIPWKSATDEERLDIDNGILLSPNLDALFDKHLISFNNEGYIIISSKIKGEEYKLLGIHPTMRIRTLTLGNKRYLEMHRHKLNESN